LTGETRYSGPSGSFHRSNLQLLRNGLSSGAKTPAPAQFTWKKPAIAALRVRFPQVNRSGAYVWALGNARGRMRALIECVPQNAVGLRFTGHTLNALVECANSWLAENAPPFPGETRCRGPSGPFHREKAERSALGARFPWGSAPNPGLAADGLEGVGGKRLPNTPGREAVWWGGSQEQSAFGGPADAEPQGAPRLSS